MNTMTNGRVTIQQREETMVHEAVHKLITRICEAGHGVPARISIVRRHNRDTGPHVHASASVTIRFDESCDVEQAGAVERG